MPLEVLAKTARALGEVAAEVPEAVAVAVTPGTLEAEVGVEEPDWSETNPLTSPLPSQKQRKTRRCPQPRKQLVRKRPSGKSCFGHKPVGPLARPCSC